MRIPAVTVVIPTYDRARYLGEAIRSVLDQVFTDFEVIVVDDGSADDTAGMVHAIRDARLQYLRRPHRGIGAALNAGLRGARGRYVARLDSDDVWLPEMLETLVPVLDARPEVGVAYARGQAMDQQGRRLPQLQGLPERFPGESLRSLLYDDCTCNVALLARRVCFDRVGGYDEALIANEDWDMWLRVARYWRFAFVDRVLARIRWHDGNLTAPTSPQFAAVLAARAAPLDKLFRDPGPPAVIRAMQSAAYANVHLFRGLRWLQARAFRNAGREFGLALRVSDRRLETAARIAWFTGAVPALRRVSLGRRGLSTLATLRRRRRASRAAPGTQG